MRINKAEIALNDIKIHAFHGVLPEERLHGTDYIVNVNCCFDKPNKNINRILESDNLVDTIDYSVINNIIEEEMQIASNLIESVAARIGKRILQMTKVSKVNISIQKLNPPMPGNCKNASVYLSMHK